MKLQDISQNNNLPIRLITNDFGHLSPEAAKRYHPTSRLSYYFIFLMLDGTTKFGLDLSEIEINSNEMFFSLPWQVQQLPAQTESNKYFKLGFDEACLSQLPKQYLFLLDLLNQPKIHFKSTTIGRLKSLFEILLQLLTEPDADSQLILAHLNSLLTEIDLAYQCGYRQISNEKLSKFIAFKVLVESSLTKHKTIGDIAKELALSTDSLCLIVRNYSGLSSKEFITNRLILEAKRRIYYDKKKSVKELAFELGFNDPNYFSRLFKKVTGKTIGSFFQELS